MLNWEKSCGWVSVMVVKMDQDYLIGAAVVIETDCLSILGMISACSTLDITKLWWIVYIKPFNPKVQHVNMLSKARYREEIMKSVDYEEERDFYKDNPYTYHLKRWWSYIFYVQRFWKCIWRGLVTYRQVLERWEIHHGQRKRHKGFERRCINISLKEDTFGSTQEDDGHTNENSFC